MVSNVDRPRPPRRLVVGITGASGAIYGIRLLEVLRNSDIETHLVVSVSGRINIVHETGRSLAEVEGLADEVHNFKNIGATIASGSFETMGMIVAPCTVHSLSEITYGVTSNLLTRAADVTLKEVRKLVLMVRETPLHLGHLRTMTQAAEIGAVIMPPVPAFYNQPRSIDDMVDYTVKRALDHFNIDTSPEGRWNGLARNVDKEETEGADG